MADTAKAAQIIDFAGGGQDGTSKAPVSQVQQNAYKREGLFLPSYSGTAAQVTDWVMARDYQAKAYRHHLPPGSPRTQGREMITKV